MSELRDDPADHYRPDWRNHLRNSTTGRAYYLRQAREALAAARQRRLEREAAARRARGEDTA